MLLLLLCHCSLVCNFYFACSCSLFHYSCRRHRSDFRKRVAAKLYKKYIAEGAPLQVNISGRIRVHIRAQLGGPCPSAGRLVFGPAQDEVFALMLAGSYRLRATHAECSCTCPRSA